MGTIVVSRKGRPDGVYLRNGRGCRPSRWCDSIAKRAFDVIGTLVLLVAVLPVLLASAVLIRLTSRGGILFKQARVGKNGREFLLLKFRTMAYSRESEGPGLTRCGDARINRTGKFLRRWKLDELPQLINVLAGSMSLVGPRPDLRKYWQQLGKPAQAVLSVRPGITGPASLTFRNEENLLGLVSDSDIETFYVGKILPLKVACDLAYLERASLRGDIRILWQTVVCVVTGNSGTELEFTNFWQRATGIHQD